MELQTLIAEYTQKANNLADLADLKAALEAEDDTLVSEYCTLARNSILLSATLKDYKEETRKSKELSVELQNLLAEMLSMNEKLNSLSEEVPKYLPNSQQSNIATSVSDARTPETKSAPRRKPGVSAAKRAGEGGKCKSTKVSQPPVLAYITAKEFTSVPGYMKGRILYSEANKAIDVLNQAAREKYQIVNKTKGLTDYQRRKKMDYLELEGKDTENLHFVTDQDIPELTSTKLDKHFLSLLTIIRHCGRVRQTRTGKITKYVIVAC